ncbi:MAG: hypothetical protein HQM16_07245 [Deltaproteobacteria bacterium]|nr:hypothetical protein [Deltaproteobacteria bacterium]
MPLVNDTLRSWRTRTLAQIMSTETVHKRGFDYDKTARDHFARIEETAVQFMYIQPDSPNNDMTKYATYPDFLAISLACRLLRAQTWSQKVDIMIRSTAVATDSPLFSSTGITCRLSFEFFLNSLRVLDRDQVAAILNPYEIRNGKRYYLMQDVEREFEARLQDG